VIQLTAHMRLLAAVEPVDFRCGIDGLAQVCRARLGADPFLGTVFLFRNRSATAVKVLVYDGQGFWLCHKRLSAGKFRHWPTRDGAMQCELLAHELAVLLCGGDPGATRAAPQWRPLVPAAMAV
jgi:transposase